MQTSSLSRSWRIRITQLSCDSPGRAPEGCLQYYTGIAGNVASFNWKLTDNALGPTFSNHLANLDYNVCIRSRIKLFMINFNKESVGAPDRSWNF
jgi:hypothetical protein